MGQRRLPTTDPHRPRPAFSPRVGLWPPTTTPVAMAPVPAPKFKAKRAQQTVATENQPLTRATDSTTIARVA